MAESRLLLKCKKIVPPMRPKTVKGIAIIKRILKLKPLPIGSSSDLQPGHASRYVGAMSMTNIKTKAHQKNLYILTLLSPYLRNTFCRRVFKTRLQRGCVSPTKDIPKRRELARARRQKSSRWYTYQRRCNGLLRNALPLPYPKQ